MGLLDVFKKKSPSAITRIKQPTVDQNVDRVYYQTKNQIESGLAKSTASTGKLIAELRGAAKRVAQISNIGGGSKAIGGNGIDGGLDTLTKHAQARTAKVMLDSSKQKRLGNK